MNPLVARVAEQARRDPTAPALVDAGQLTSYAELVDSVRAVAAGLAGAPQGPVAVLARKSARAVGLVLGVLAAGRTCFVPGPGLPPATLRTLLGQAGCVQVISPDTDWDAERAALVGAAAGADRPVPSGPTAPDPASFLLTTSGSTGTPKIVPLGAGAVDRFVDWVHAAFDVGPGRRVLSYAPLNFDLSLFEVWATLAHGGQVVLVDPDTATGPRLLDLLRTRQVHVVEAVPLLYELLVDAARPHGVRLDTPDQVVVTGDAIRPACLAALPALFPNARLTNVYGCTETNDSFRHEVRLPRDAAGPLPLGDPLPGVSALLVDDAGRVVTGPGVGELYVHTPFQTSGYLHPSGPPRFVAHPERADGRRYFRSGDLVRRDPDGTLTLSGRNDFQVKIRGQQVNLQEVENVLLAHDDVREAVVVAVSREPGGRSLHAVVRRRAASGLTDVDVRTFGARRLPAAAVPSTVRITDGPLPRTATGKPDRDRIRTIETSRRQEQS
ncbi:AMP-binding protein [Micromonospora sp. NPDC023956]|uniref:AMP-binding protein n=1 Tax=Micromonospora sp. NPDC023956 TaxID=3155722 RepID=UPI00340D68E6